jgi:hypothetical protein
VKKKARAPKSRRTAAARAAIFEAELKLGEAIDAINRRTKESPGFGAWLRLYNLLEAARQDPTIVAHAPALETIDLLLEILGDAPGARDADQAMQPLIDVLKREQKQRAGEKRGQQLKDEARLWQDRIRPEALRLIKAGKLSDEGIGALLSSKAGVKADTVARFVASLRKARHKNSSD